MLKILWTDIKKFDLLYYFFKRIMKEYPDQKLGSGYALTILTLAINYKETLDFPDFIKDIRIRKN